MKNIIPELPEPFVVTEELQQKLEKWVEYFKNISPRIKMWRPSDENFTLEKFEVLTKEIIESCYDIDHIDQITLKEWPKKENIAFIVGYDSSLPGHSKRFLPKDVRIFCYGDFAFGLGYFERDSDSSDDDFILDYPESALSWNYMAKIIRDEILEIQKQIKNENPPSSEEKLFGNRDIKPD